LAAVFDEMWYRFKPPPQPLTEAEMDVLREGMNRALNEAIDKEKERGNG
jgi:hypothetical protein